MKIYMYNVHVCNNYSNTIIYMKICTMYMFVIIIFHYHYCTVCAMIIMLLYLIYGSIRVCKCTCILKVSVQYISMYCTCNSTQIERQKDVLHDAVWSPRREDKTYMYYYSSEVLHLCLLLYTVTCNDYN